MVKTEENLKQPEEPAKDAEYHFSLPIPSLLMLPKHDNPRVSITSEALSDVPSDVIIQSRIKYGRRMSAFKGLLMEYGKATTIHGIRYIFEVHRPIYEKLYWLILTCASAYIAISLIWSTYLKWQDSPVILGFDETLVPVHKIPFPTITICPEIKMDRNEFDFTNITRRMWEEYENYKNYENNANLTEEELTQIAATLQICDDEVVQRFTPFIPPDILPDVAQTLVDLSLTKNLTAPFCKWNGRFYFCDKLFNFVATDEGICYQFNGLRNEDIYRDERFVSYGDPEIIDFNNFFDPLPPLNNITGTWSLDEGYIDQGYNAYPQRTVFASVRNAFFAFMQGFEHNFDYDCRNSKQGYKVFLNSPDSVPLTTGNYILVPHGDEVMVTVLPQYVMSTSDLHEFSPEKRQCFFDDERYLRFFRHYSQSNCQTECLANFTIAKCGCAKFWMPKPLDIPVCTLADYPCFSTAQQDLNLLLENETLTHSMDINKKLTCNCMPSCTSLEYNFEISRARYDISLTLIALRENYEHTDAVASRLSVYFKEHQFTAIKRTTLFGITTFIANCGGICGLFMGISCLSFIELIYFFTMRLYSNCHDRRKTKIRLIQEQEEQEKISR